MRFSRQGYWSGLPFPSPGDLPNPGIEPGSPALQANSLPTELQGKPNGVKYLQVHSNRELISRIYKKFPQLHKPSNPVQKWAKDLSRYFSKKIYKWLTSMWKDVQHHYSFSSVQLLSHVRLFVTPWPGSSVHGILQARILEWAAISFSRGTSRPRGQTWVSCIAGSFLHCRWILC